jgi:hypothetical protein
MRHGIAGDNGSFGSLDPRKLLIERGGPGFESLSEDSYRIGPEMPTPSEAAAAAMRVYEIPRRVCARAWPGVPHSSGQKGNGSPADAYITESSKHRSASKKPREWKPLTLVATTNLRHRPTPSPSARRNAEPNAPFAVCPASTSEPSG